MVARRDDNAARTVVLLTTLPWIEPKSDIRSAVLAALPSAIAETVTDIRLIEDDTIPHGPTGKVRKCLLRQAMAAEPVRR
ncbi:hypothetical protein ACIRRA_05895 [Nocardia sp. NPDC101769]|uniref:hypothetical protein n=1 Tax=Nocardia sp. NPDC101769 TaxID=3364333 RepID=UPI0037FFAFBC